MAYVPISAGPLPPPPPRILCEDLDSKNQIYRFLDSLERIFLLENHQKRTPVDKKKSGLKNETR